MRPTWRVGLTGGIGSGKSTVARMLRDKGAALVDADAIARACTLAGGPAMPAIATRFGSNFVRADGSLDRDRMRRHAFADPQARAQLEAIVHPLVAQEVIRQAAASRSVCTVFDLPLLVESPRWRSQLDHVVVVDCAPDTQIQRVMTRNGWERKLVEAVLKQQSTRLQRLAAADAVLFNDRLDLTELRHNVYRLAQRFGL